MKKVIIGLITLFAILILLLIGYWNLPVEINRKSDIKYGNTLIENIEQYKRETNSLPKKDDWETLKKLGFDPETLGVKPFYNTDDKDTFELVFIEGFDGPYLLWNSQERKWKIAHPTIFKTESP